MRDELLAPREIGRLLRYGEKFGPHKIDLRMVPLQLPITSGAFAIGDPTTPKTWSVLDRPVGTGTFRVMLSLAKDRLAAAVVHVGRPPIARWTVGHARGQKKPKPEQLPAIVSTSGWLAITDGTAPDAPLALPATGEAAQLSPTTLAFPSGKGEFVAYWAVDATDKPVCLVIDFDAFTQKEWKAKPV